MNCVKLVFSLYNLVFLLTGAGLLGVGLWFRFDTNASKELTEIIEDNTKGQVDNDIINLINQSAYVLIAFGGILFLLSLLGYCGAVKESRFLLGFYTLLLFLILVLEIVAAVLIVTYYPEAKDKTQELLKEKLVNNYKNGDHGNFTEIMDKIMKNYQCCGIINGTDFETSKYTLGKIPAACCKDGTDSCTGSPTDFNSNISTGCFDKILESIMSESGKKWAIAVGVIIGILELAGIIFACCLYREAKYNFN